MVRIQEFLNVFPKIGFWKFYIKHEEMKLGFYEAVWDPFNWFWLIRTIESDTASFCLVLETELLFLMIWLFCFIFY